MPLRFTATASMTGYNAGIANINFSEESKHQSIPEVNAKVLLERHPKNFRVTLPDAQPSGTEVPEEEAAEEVAAEEEPQVTRQSLESLTVSRLRRLAAQEANEGETVPRVKAELVDFIMDHIGE